MLTRSGIMLAALALLLVGQSLHAADHALGEPAEQCVVCAQHHGSAAPPPQNQVGVVRLDLNDERLVEIAQDLADAPVLFRPGARAPPPL